MATNYPSGLDTTSTFPVDVTNDTDSQSGTPRTGLAGFLAQWMRDTGAAVVAIQNELGTLPKGSSLTVKDRLNENERKAQALVASTANVSLPNPGGSTLTIDGVALANGDRVLLKDQTAPATNGVYFVAGIGTTVVLDRATDLDTASEIADAEVGVSSGAVHGDSRWRMTTSLPITVNTTALRWTRVYPSYTPLQRNPWEVGTAPPLVTNMARYEATASVAQTAITALTSLHGYMVLRAGTTYTNVNSFCTATGSGAVTLNHYSIVRQSDRAVLQRTANVTTLPALGTYTRALQATLVVDVDTPVWIAWSTQVATTSPAFAGQPAITALVQPLALVAPISQGNSTTTPTSTPPTVGAVLGAPTTATSPLVYFWLT